MFKVVVLISTYNGKEYIEEQLDSLLSQTYDFFEIIARDDKSSDSTVTILNSYKNIETIPTFENLGAKNSFVSLLEYAVENSDAEYFMFCDQDDVWQEDKIEKTIAKMQEMEKKFLNIPLLVHTDLMVVDEQLNVINNSFMQFQKIDPSKNKLNKLLMQNTVTGCTMMINKKLAKMCLSIPKEAIMHDWWIALVASQFGYIGFIHESTIKYRQHGNNTIGAKGFKIKPILQKVLEKNTLEINIKQAKAFLKEFDGMLDHETLNLLNDFVNIKKQSWLQRRVILFKYRLFKYGILRNLGLLLRV